MKKISPWRVDPSWHATKTTQKLEKLSFLKRKNCCWPNGLGGLHYLTRPTIFCGLDELTRGEFLLLSTFYSLKTNIVDLLFFIILKLIF